MHMAISALLLTNFTMSPHFLLARVLRETTGVWVYQVYYLNYSDDIFKLCLSLNRSNPNVIKRSIKSE